MGPELVFIVGIALLGACIGSFLNVVAYRLPRECMSIVSPRSACPKCRRPIRWTENLPILSYLLLRGRCRGCRTDIPPRYFLVEILTSLLFLAVLYMSVPKSALLDPLSHGAEWLLVAVRLLITSGLIALSLIDIDYRILPDEITKSGIVLGPVCAFLAPAIQPSAGPFAGLYSPRVDALVHGLVGAVSAGLLLWLVGWLGAKAFKKEAMGFGDVKMLAAMGGFLGFWSLLALVVASVGGAVVGVLRLLISKDRYVPFGPFLALGMWVVMLRGEKVFHLYFGLFAR